MNGYKCTKCGYVEHVSNLNDGFTCPMCSANKEEFIVYEESIIKGDIEAIIDSVVEEEKELENSTIININDEDKRVKISEYNPGIMRINEKCINCGQCKKTCEKIVGLSYDLNVCKEPICLSCGQCILHCPSGALVPKYSYGEVRDIIAANEKIVVALTSPGVRVAIGEGFGHEDGKNMEGKLVSALKKVGFDYVFDTTFGADLTILEEVAELADRISNKKTLPQFTSCCPAWIRYAEVYHPELLGNISTCKSPIGMQCSIIKNYFSELKGFEPSKIVTVAITPCTSKKMEAKEYVENVDYVLTTSELILLLKEEEVKFDSLYDADYDSVLGSGTGAGILFGNTGGVMEASIRTLYRIMTKKNPPAEIMQLEKLRGFDDIKTATIDIAGLIIRVAVVNGMRSLEELLENDRYKKYHFIEVMNCKGGCIGGGGQPLCSIPALDDVRKKRMMGLYEADKQRQKRCSHDNPEVKELYKKYLKKPNSEISEKLLHTSYSDKSSLLKREN